MKTKKQLTIILALVILLSLCACTRESERDSTQPQATGTVHDVSEQMGEIVESNAKAEVGSYVRPGEDEFTWDVSDSGVTITGFQGMETAIEIPDELAGKPVTAIGTGAFGNSQVIGVKIPDSVIEIQEKAFYFCTTLKEVEFGANVTTMGNQAFEGCLALSKVVTNEGLTEIGYMAFTNTPSLEVFEFPNTVQEIKTGAFTMSGIKTVLIPGNVQTIGKQAFSTCENLESVVIEDGTTTLDKKVFEACKNLKTAELPGSLTEIGELVFVSSNNVTIIAPAGSEAEAYAADYEIPFQAK